MLSLVLFFFITGIYINYNPCWVDLYCINLLGYYFYFYIDSIAVSFILLTGFFIILALLFILNTNAANRIEYMCCIVSIGVLLVLVFSTTHLLLFYVYFESILIPFFFLIGIYGTKSRRVHASYVFFFYTIIGSIWMLIGIVYVYTLIGSFDILVLSNSLLTEKQEHLLWFLFFLGFSVKIPIVPFHIWLPEAHVEAPTEASVLLAALLLKIGTYGLYRIVLVPFTNASFYYCNFLILLNLISMVHASLVALRQIDIKKI